MKQDHVLVTGAAGFIGSNLCSKLTAVNEKFVPLDMKIANWRNLSSSVFDGFVYDYELVEWDRIKAIVHCGAISNTREEDADRLFALNYMNTIVLAKKAKELGVPFIYMSSAATYGQGDSFVDSEDPNFLKKLLVEAPTLYASTKARTDHWLNSRGFFYRECVYGLKLFNVYGPNEGHKKEMASFIYQTAIAMHEQTYPTIRLFDWMEHCLAPFARDFVHVDQVVATIRWILKDLPQPGIYNVGSGSAVSFEEVVSCVATSLNKKAYDIIYKPLPKEWMSSYQRFTVADMTKTIKAGFPTNSIIEPKQGIEDFCKNYLADRGVIRYK